MTVYATKIQFRNAAKKLNIQINNDQEYSRMKISIRDCYDIDNKAVMGYGKDKEKQVGFEFYGLSVEQALKLHANGFELHAVEVPAQHGTKRIAYIYRLAIK